MADSNEQRDPLGEMSNEEFDALTPPEKAARTREANRREDEAKNTDGGGQQDPDATNESEDDGGSLFASDGFEEDESTGLNVGDEAVTWLTADARGRVRKN